MLARKLPVTFCNMLGGDFTILRSSMSASIQRRVTSHYQRKGAVLRSQHKDSSKNNPFPLVSLKTVQFDEVLIGYIRSFLGFNYLTQAADTSISQFNNELENVNDFSKL